MQRQVEKRHLIPITVLLLLAVAVRLPFIYLSVIDWDESTFILIGQSLLDGNLPYTEFWDLKPPLAFVPFAMFIWLFGENIIGVRIGGILLVFITGLFVYLIGNRLWGRSAGALAGILSIIFISIASRGQAVMTETIAIVPLMAAAYLATKSDIGSREFFWIALLLSLATLVRLNLAYTAVLVFLHLLVQTDLTYRAFSLRVILLFALGGLLPILLVSLPYFISGYTEIYIKSMVSAPLAYSSIQGSLVDNLLRHIQAELSWHKAPFWLAALGGIGLLFFTNKMATTGPRRSGYLLVTFFVGTLFSILKSGAAWGHYLIQILPLAALPAGFLYSWLVSLGPRIVTTFVVAAVLLLSAQPVIKQYIFVGRVWKSGGSVYSTDVGHVLSDALRELNPEKAPIYLTTHHIAYWLTDTKPVSSPVIHPSNIGRPYLLTVLSGSSATTLDGLRAILDQEPKFIVKKAQVSYLVGHQEANALLRSTLENNYHLVARVGYLFIHQRINP